MLSLRLKAVAEHFEQWQTIGRATGMTDKSDISGFAAETLEGAKVSARHHGESHKEVQGWMAVILSSKKRDSVALLEWIV